MTSSALQTSVEDGEPVDILAALKPGGGDSLPPMRDDRQSRLNAAGHPVRTGVWLALATILMMFAAFTSAAVVRKGAANDWDHIVLPSIVYLNTALLLLSSVTLEFARRNFYAYTRGKLASYRRPKMWLLATLTLGLLFIAGQIAVWSKLRSQGVGLITSPSGSFFYILTIFHALHLIGGLGGLLRVLRKVNGFNLRRSTLDGMAYYWHFMGALWIYLLMLIWLKF